MVVRLVQPPNKPFIAMTLLISHPVRLTVLRLKQLIKKEVRG